MAAGIMYELGEPVTCDGPCDHKDCAEMRRDFADRECQECGTLVEPGSRFYMLHGRRANGAWRIIHATCGS